MKVNVKNIIFFVAMILVFVLAASFWSASANKAEEPIWSDVVAMLEENRVTKFVVSPSHLLTLEGLDAEIAIRES